MNNQFLIVEVQNLRNQPSNVHQSAIKTASLAFIALNGRFRAS